MNNEWVVQKARRYLLSLHNFTADPSLSNEAIAGAMHLGRYVNTDSVVDFYVDRVVLTSRAETTQIRYEHVADINTPSSDDPSSNISIELQDGMTKMLPIDGTKGQYRDIYMVSSFLHSVVRGVQRGRSSN